MAEREKNEGRMRRKIIFVFFLLLLWQWRRCQMGLEGMAKVELSGQDIPSCLS